jgi:hypothetical protein
MSNFEVITWFSTMPVDASIGAPVCVARSGLSA